MVKLCKQELVVLIFTDDTIIYYFFYDCRKLRDL